MRLGINLDYARRIAKTGAMLQIGLLVFDYVWILVRFVIFNTTFKNRPIPQRFLTLDNLITNLLFTSLLLIFSVGVILIGLYYIKKSQFGIIAGIFLAATLGIKIAFIFFRFIQLITESYEGYMEMTFHLFELSTAMLFMSSFILYDIFLIQLQKREGIGYGGSFFPYLYVLFGLIFPIANLLAIIGVPFWENRIVLAIMETITLIAGILEIIVYFDFIRRTDQLKPEAQEETQTEQTSESPQMQKKEQIVEIA
ncbi:MAG: hypothetical protein GF308_20300 [Candidatus Heimdallarchaeota archaeon]|nr:hypothetical protein [Candidatus Heimdallarchaeota archaeon]